MIEMFICYSIRQIHQRNKQKNWKIFFQWRINLLVFISSISFFFLPCLVSYLVFIFIRKNFFMIEYTRSLENNMICCHQSNQYSYHQMRTKHWRGRREKREQQKERERKRRRRRRKKQYYKPTGVYMLLR